MYGFVRLRYRVVVVVVVVISFTLTSPLRGYAGYHNYGYPNLTTVNVQIICRRILCLVGACVIQTDFDPLFVLLLVPGCKISLMLLQNPVLHLLPGHQHYYHYWVQQSRTEAAGTCSLL